MLFQDYLTHLFHLIQTAETQLTVPPPRETPFENFYNSRKSLQIVEKTIKEVIQNENLLLSIKNQLSCLLNTISIYLGINCTRSEETPDGRKYLLNSVPKFEVLYSFSDLSEDIVVDTIPEWGDEITTISYFTVLSQATIFLNGCNELGILQSEYEENDEALRTFELASSLYQILTSEMEEQKFPYTSQSRYDFEVLFTHTAFYLAQHYGNNGNEELAQYYCGLTLYRQLKYNNYVPHEWIKNCLSFCEVFFTRGHLLLPIPLIQKCEEIYHKSTFDDDRDYQLEARGNIDITYAAVYSSSLRYCWTLRTTGSPIVQKDIPEQILDVVHQIIGVEIQSNIPESVPAIPTSGEHPINVCLPESNAVNPADTTTLPPQTTGESDTAPPLPAPLPNNNETSESNGGTDRSPVPDMIDINQDEKDFSYLTQQPSSAIAVPEGREDITYEQAKVLFKNANSYYGKAKMYFALDGWVTDHINILKDQSKLYFYLTFYETDPTRKIAMNKKRSDLFETLITELNTQSFSNIITELHYELGDIYTASFDAKMEKIKEKQDEAEAKHTSYTLKKIELDKLRLFSTNAINHYTAFLKYYMVKDKPPETLETDSISPYINASFSIARMNSKLADTFGNDLSLRLKYDRQSLSYYKLVSDFGKKNSKSLDTTTSTFVQIATEMCSLLPSKLDSISAELNQR